MEAKDLLLSAISMLDEVVEHHKGSNDKPALRQALNDRADSICREYENSFELREQIEYGQEVEIERSVVHSEVVHLEDFEDLQDAIHNEAVERHP